MIEIRRAKPQDALAIHEAHMRSIREVCGKDYTQEQLDAWGGRPYREAERLKIINDDCTWVIESDGRIEGYGHLIDRGDGQGEIAGLYFTPEVAGRGFGKTLLQLMEAEARLKRFTELSLFSTLTAVKFYQRCGFEASAPTSIKIRDVQIPCIPMKKVL